METAEIDEETARKWDARTRTLIGDACADKLAASRVLVVGVGGVGGYAAEILLRSGVGNLTLMDADCVDITNLNRQLIATLNTLHQPKAILYAERFHDINPWASINALHEFLTPENAVEVVGEGKFDYVVDAIDTVSSKVALLSACLRSGTCVVSAMGAGGRFDPSQVYLTDVWKTEGDGLARAVRRSLRKAGLRQPLTVVASHELPKAGATVNIEGVPGKRTSPGTLPAVPATFGVMMGAHVVNQLIER